MFQKCKKVFKKKSYFIRRIGFMLHLKNEYAHKKKHSYVMHIRKNHF